MSEGKKKRAAKKSTGRAAKKRAGSGGKKGAGSGAAKGAAKSGRARTRAGMPAPDSVVSETTFKSPKGTVYRMLETIEVDEYEEKTDSDE